MKDDDKDFRIYVSQISISSIFWDTVIGMAIEKAATTVYEKYKKTDQEKAALIIKEKINEKIHSNCEFSYLLPWNNAVQVSNLMLIDFLKPEGIFSSLKRFQEAHGFFDKNGSIVKSDTELYSVSSTLYDALEKESKLDTIRFAFEKEFQEIKRDDSIDYMQKQLDQILNELKNLQMRDDNLAYAHEFNKPLFLNMNQHSCCTLDKMYCSPSIHLNSGEDQTAADVINAWFKHDMAHSVLLLLGDAGVGKSTLCRKMVWDAIMPNHSKSEFQIPFEVIHVIPLRKYFDEVEKWKPKYSVTLLLKSLFDIKRPLKGNELFVLDGLDEVEILCPTFPFDEFFSDLQSFSEYGMKVMITSRKTDCITACLLKYSENKEEEIESQIVCHTLSWNDETVNNWCDHYRKYHFDLDYDRWMQHFLESYNSLPANDSRDTRREILRIPIVLYIVCYTQVDLKKNSSVCSIYDQAFHKILDRDHNKHATDVQVLNTRKSKKEAIARLVQWQFTKELALQLFLNNKQTDAIKNAKKRTIEILQLDGVQISDDYRIDTNAYFAVFHFARETDDKRGVVFAHRTVLEYFTAVKFYEDYLQKTTSSDDTFEVWNLLVAAFRYKMLDAFILDYLLVLHQKDDSVTQYEHFYRGICEQLILSIPFQQHPVPEYCFNTECLLPSNQLHILFSNLTRYMTGRGYRNLENDASLEFQSCLQILFQQPPLRSEITDSERFYYLKQWNLSNCTFSGAHLRFTYLEGAILSGATLSSASLDHAVLNQAHLEEAHLENADMKSTFLREAHLEKAHLENAFMECAILEEAHLNEAHLEFAKMKKARLLFAHLEDSHLNMARLEEAELEDAFLERAHLEGAFLQGANLARAHLNETSFIGAHLQWTCLKDTDLERAYLKGAFYNSLTEFPDGFDPIAHGMIKVDNN